MNKGSILLLISFILLTSCHLAKDRLVESKSSCYAYRLDNLKRGNLYNDIHRNFEDTFKVMVKNRIRPSLLQEKIDDGLFLNMDSTECILIILERPDNRIGEFGSSRVYRGELMNGEWKFKKSMWFTYDKGYFKRYSDNTFENISEIARYSILTAGNAKLSGCDIDENYWFKLLKD